MKNNAGTENHYEQEKNKINVTVPMNICIQLNCEVMRLIPCIMTLLFLIIVYNSVQCGSANMKLFVTYIFHF